MKQVLFFIAVVSLVLCQDAAFAQNHTTAEVKDNSTTITVKHNITTRPIANVTTPASSTERNPFPEKDTNGLLQRSLYVAIGISSIVAIYFIVRAVKTRGRRKAKKYGVIHGTGSMELQPLDKDVDEEEEDMTLFDRKGTKWPK